ncbi:hypothetical protein [Phenylobacterium sp. J367]|uniref:hypothetical protein n=1 Tax=Phenylobacterium sp. J367 TaxID=2898435 RepID=UPI0021507B5A|nr:hypothetical protein [Phenylobacterium sp. J367]MCR5880102.1 hypothetical protein [Phenylobacterium sp. J367]
MLVPDGIAAAVVAGRPCVGLRHGGAGHGAVHHHSLTFAHVVGAGRGPRRGGSGRQQQADKGQKGEQEPHVLGRYARRPRRVT